MKSVIVFCLVACVCYVAAKPLIVPEIPLIDMTEISLLPLFGANDNTAFTLRDAKEMEKRLEGIPFVTTTTKADDETYIPIGPIKSTDLTYSGTLKRPEKITKHLEGIPFVTTTRYA